MAIQLVRPIFTVIFTITFPKVIDALPIGACQLIAATGTVFLVCPISTVVVTVAHHNSIDASAVCAVELIKSTRRYFRWGNRSCGYQTLII